MVSLNQKLWTLVAAATVTKVAGVAQVESLKKLPPAEVVARLRAVAAPTLEGLPKLSCVCTVAAPEQAPATTVCGALVYASFATAAALMVCAWLAGVRPAALAVSLEHSGQIPLPCNVGLGNPSRSVWTRPGNRTRVITKGPTG